MTRTITAMFDDYEDASEAVRKLKTAGIPDADISIIGNNAESRAHGSGTDGTHDHDADATGTGVAAGRVSALIASGPQRSTRARDGAGWRCP